ncbi:MAG: substrate-binding domain-containing protein [Planctomycetota bacterium]|nr:substrate-binding domain-containing protein [Planctomycetota bacterium]
MAKFVDIADQITEDIRLGRFGKPGDRFLTVRALAEQSSVSLVTAQKIVARLRDNGVLVGNENSPTSIGPIAGTDLPGNDSTGKRPIALVLPDLTNPFFNRLSRHVQRTAAEQGHSVLVAGTESKLEREREVIQDFLELGIDGLLLCAGLDESCALFYRELQSQGFPLVFVSRQPEHVEADFVVPHNLMGGVAVASHFVESGFSTAGYIGFGPRLRRDSRLAGFRAELLEFGVELPPEWLANDNGRGIEHGYRAMQRVMDGRKRPRAVFALNDLLAIGAMQYCHDHGIDVPGEVAIAGFDDLPESRVTAPPLTTVAYPIEATAQIAVQCLIDRIASDEAFTTRRILLEPRLVIRGSTDPQAETRRKQLLLNPKAAKLHIDTRAVT